MTGQALEAMRYGAEGGQEEAAGMVEAVRQRLLVLSKEDRAEPALLLLILREFALAKLDPGPELRQQMQRLAEETPASAPGPGDIETLDAHLEDLAREAGGRPVPALSTSSRDGRGLSRRPPGGDGRLAAPVSRSGLYGKPPLARCWMPRGRSGTRPRRASSRRLGWAACQVRCSGTSLRCAIGWPRLIAWRWTGRSRRAGVKASRLARCHRRRCGRSSCPASMGQGRKASSSLPARAAKMRSRACLVKHGIGVRDAWARHGLSRAECDDFREQLEQVDIFPASLDYVRAAAAHALAVNLRSGVMPPFAMIDFLETAGLQGLQPEELPTNAVMALLEAAAIPALLQPEAVASLLASSRDLPDQIQCSSIPGSSRIRRLIACSEEKVVEPEADRLGAGRIAAPAGGQGASGSPGPH